MQEQVRYVIKCPNCNRKFGNPSYLQRHAADMHQTIMMLDENVSIAEPRVVRLIRRGWDIIPQKPSLKEKSDFVILNFLMQKHYGLITYDREFATIAKARGIKVLLLSHT